MVGLFVQNNEFPYSTFVVEAGKWNARVTSRNGDFVARHTSSCSEWGVSPRVFFFNPRDCSVVGVVGDVDRNVQQGSVVVFVVVVCLSGFPVHLSMMQVSSSVVCCRNGDG